MIVKTMAAYLMAAFCIVAVNTSAEAKHRRHITTQADLNGSACEYNNDGRIICGFVPISRPSAVPMGRKHIAPSNGYAMAERVVSHPSGCPRSAFCGCGVAVRLWGEPKRAFWPASAYFRFPAAMPASGMVAVRAHHVFYIESVNNDGTVVAYDPNSGGHLTRIHTISLSGYSVRDPNGARMAMR